MSALTLWGRRDPFAEFDALIKDAFGTTQSRFGFTPAADVVREGDDAVVRLELPGIDPSKDVTVEVDHGRLIVSGERRDEHAEQRDGGTFREVRYGSFRRSFQLPEHVDADQVSAGYQAGVLTVRVPAAYAGSTVTRVPVTGATEPAAIEAEQPAEAQA